MLLKVHGEAGVGRSWLHPTTVHILVVYGRQVSELDPRGVLVVQGRVNEGASSVVHPFAGRPLAIPHQLLLRR